MTLHHVYRWAKTLQHGAKVNKILAALKTMTPVDRDAYFYNNHKQIYELQILRLTRALNGSNIPLMLAPEERSEWCATRRALKKALKSAAMGSQKAELYEAAEMDRFHIPLAEYIRKIEEHEPHMKHVGKYVPSGLPAPTKITS